MKYKLKRPLPYAEVGTIWEGFIKAGRYWLMDKTNEVYTFPTSTFSDWFEEVDERWKPVRDQEYFFIAVTGCIFSDYWNGTPGEADAYQIGNCFRTRELAEKAAEQIKALLKEFHKNNP